MIMLISKQRLDIHRTLSSRRNTQALRYTRWDFMFFSIIGKGSTVCLEALYNVQNIGEYRNMVNDSKHVSTTIYAKYVSHYCYLSKFQNRITMLIFNATSDTNDISVSDCH